MVRRVIFPRAFNGLGLEIYGHISFPKFTVTLENCFINFSVSVEDLNIRGQESSQGDFKAESGKSDACRYSTCQNFYIVQLLRSGHWKKCPSAGYVQCPIMSELG